MNKKITSIVAGLVMAAGMTAFGQGYFNFSTGGGFVYDDFTTPGTDVKSPGTVSVTFLWAATGTADPLGAGIATTGGLVNETGGSNTISGMLSSGWNLAQVSGTGVEADNTVHASGPSTGGIGYGTFQVNNSTAGGTYEIVVIGWAASSGANLAAGLSGALGWSSAFTYASSASSLQPAGQFSAVPSDMAAFGVANPASTPEPTSLALAGLGGLSMLFLRRRKS